MNSETGKANPADPRAAKMPAIPEDDLAHFEALVDRMLRDRAEAIHAVQEPLVDAPKITISHPAEFFAVERRVEERATVPPPPWTVRHARKLIGTGVLVVGAGTAYLAYNNGWRFPTEPMKTAAPAAGEPAPVQRPITPAPQTPTAAAPPAQPAAAAPRKPAAAPRPSAPAPAPTVASPAGPRAPAVTHTLRDAAPVAVGAAAAPAVVTAPPPAAAAPSDCPEGIAALGLCASRISKGAK